MLVAVAAARVASWVGPGAPHPEVLDALADEAAARAPFAHDEVVAHAGSLAALVVALPDDAPFAEMPEVARLAFAGADAKALAIGLAAAARPPAFALVRLAPPRVPERFALFLAFGASAPLAREAARAAGAADATVLEASEDVVVVARLDAEGAALAAWLRAWRASGLAPSSVERAAAPLATPRLVALGFEAGARRLHGPLDLLEDGWPPGS